MATKLRKYFVLEDKHKGESCFIAGAGPSLWGIYHHEKYNDMFNHVFIAVNSAIFVMPWGGSVPHPNTDITQEVNTDPDKRYWVSNDALCRRWSWWTYTKNCHANKVIRDSWEKYYHEIPGFIYFWPRSTSEGEIDPDDDGLAYCSSVPTSIDLAIFMGCKQIFLLGVDQSFVQSHTHFWQFFSKPMQPRRLDRQMSPIPQQTSVFEYNNRAYPALQGYARTKRVKIYNCNPQSNVEVFEKITFDEALEQSKNVKTKKHRSNQQA